MTERMPVHIWKQKRRVFVSYPFDTFLIDMQVTRLNKVFDERPNEHEVMMAKIQAVVDLDKAAK